MVAAGRKGLGFARDPPDFRIGARVARDLPVLGHPPEGLGVVFQDVRHPRNAQQPVCLQEAQLFRLDIGDGHDHSVDAVIVAACRHLGNDPRRSPSWECQRPWCRRQVDDLRLPRSPDTREAAPGGAVRG